MGRKFSVEQATNTVTTLGAGTKFIVLTTTPENKFITSENIAADTIFTSAFQAKDAGLTSIAGLTTAADKMVYTTASDVYAVTSLSAFARTILDDADATAVRATIGVDASGTDNSTNVSLAGTLDYITLTGQVLTRNAIDLTTDTTGTLAVTSGGTGLTSISTLLNSNVTPTSLGLLIGTNVQAYDAGLQALADLADGSGVLTNNGSGGLSWAAAGGTGDALVANPLSQFATTTSLQLLGVMSDETGTGSLVFGTAPTFASIADTGVVSAGTWQGGVVQPTYGGTGLTSISTLLNSNVTPTTLGLVIGTDVQAYDATYLVDADIGVTVQAYDADLTTWASLTPSLNAQSLVTAADYAAMRTLLDLEVGVDFDAAGTDNSTNVSLAGTLDYITLVGQVITRNAIDLTTDTTGTLAVVSGGTGLTSLSTLLNSNVTPSSLGLVIGTNVQAYDATLASIALLGTDADKLAYTTAVDTWAETPLTAFARTILDDTDATSVRATIGVDASGTDNSTDVTLVTTTADYLSIIGQAITLGLVDLSTDVTGSLATGTVPWSQLTSVPSTFAPDAHTLDSHSNVTITANSAGEILKWDGSAWVNNTLAEAGIDPAGTDNSTNVTLSGSLDYLSLAGQVLTLGSIDLSTDVTGTLPVGNGGTGLTSLSTLLNSNVTPTSLGLVIGTHVQAYDAELQALASLANASGVLTNDGAGVLSWEAAGGAGTVTSVSGTGTVSGLTLTGTVTTSGSLTLGGTISITESQISDFGSYATLGEALIYSIIF